MNSCLLHKSRVDGGGTAKESKTSDPSRMSTTQQVLFHYTLLSIIISSTGV